MDTLILILVSGSVGAGKTTFARYLAESLNIPCFSKDDIKENLFDSLGWIDKKWSNKLSNAAFSLLFLIAEKELQANRSIILEANFKPQFHRIFVKNLMNKYSLKIFEFYLNAQVEILKERFKARVISGQRHPGHGDNLVLERYFDPVLCKPLNLGTMVEVDTSDLEKINYQELLSQLKGLVKK